MAPISYVAQVKASNMRVELRVNDVPVGIFAPGEAATTAEVPLNEFLVTGRNSATLIAHANPLPSRVLEPWLPGAAPGVQLGAPAQVQVTIVRVGGSAAAPTPVAQLAWNGGAQPVPTTGEKSFDVDIRLPGWAWTRARELQAGDAAAAFQALRALHARLAQKDASSIVALMDLKLQEVTAGAYGVPPGPLRSSFQTGLGRCMNDPTWTLLPIDPGQVDLRLVGGRRMAECLRPGGGHALMYAKQGSQSTFFLPIMLGLLDGRWQVLR